jgi:cellobiose phosphorylase
MYRLIIESLLGLNLEGDVLRLAPCIPSDWPGYVVRYRYRDTVYRIDVRQVAGPEGAAGLSVDRVRQETMSIPLNDDQATHRVEVRLPRPDG